MSTDGAGTGTGWGEHLLAELGGASQRYGAALLGRGGVQDRVINPAKKCGSS